MQSSDERSSNTEAVTKRLRQMIMTGVLPPGDRLTEVALAKKLDVSRTPVRLALTRLEQEDLVQGEPHRGFRVRRFTIEEMKQTLEVRATLEGMAARLAAERGRFEIYADEFDYCIETIGNLIARKDGGQSARQEFVEANGRFHSAISSMAGNAVLTRRLERNPFQAAPLLFVFTSQEAIEAIEASQFDHKRILDAISKGEGTRAEFAMREHALSPRAKADSVFSHIQGMSHSMAEHLNSI